jgi:hypothetical protein
MTTTHAPTLAEVLNAYCKLAIRPAFQDSQSKERAVRNFVQNLQTDGATNDRIYDRLAELSPLLGSQQTDKVI